MNIPYSWLLELLPDLPSKIGNDPHALEPILAMLGTGVEGITHYPAPPQGVIFGVVQSCTPIPNTHLYSLEVDVGLLEPKEIVTGAPNAKAGIGVAVAPPGTTIQGKLLEQRQVQGKTSWGMVCSPKELELGEYGGGLLELPINSAKAGTALAQIWAEDFVLDIEVTPNRADALSVLGVARDLAAKLQLELQLPSKGLESQHDEDFPIAVELDPKRDCDRFVVRVARGVKNQPSAAWMQRRLMLCGMRPISALVDVSNYVMLELGQPSAAYDAKDLPENKIIVRDALEGEKAVGLDGLEYTFSPKDLLVTTPVDGASRVIGIGSMLGAKYSSIALETTDVILEVAHWNPVRMRLTGRRLGIATDALYRYERGVDPNLAVWAADRYMQLVLEMCGGAALPTHRDIGGAQQGNTILLEPEFINRYLGTTFAPLEIQSALERLGFVVEPNGKTWRVLTPTWRVNMDIPEDLTEEVARILGYDQIPTTLPNLRVNDLTRSASVAYNRTRELKSAMVGLGFQEVVSYSFTNPEEMRQMRLPEPVLELRNAQSAERTHLRPTLIGSLLKAAKTNLHAKNVLLFEVGRVFPFVNLEEEQFGALLMGEFSSKTWQNGLAGGFYTFKGLLEVMAQKLGGQLKVVPIETHVPEKPECLHPGIAGALEYNGQFVGIIGALHPSVAAALELPASIVIAQMRLPLPERSWAFSDPSRQPAALRDLAILAPKGVPYAQLEQIAQNAAGAYLERIEPFDVFESEQIGAGKRSIAITLTWRAQDRTLTDEEVGAAFQNVIAAVRAAGFEIRDS
ncbi:MAG: phenylalanine--tRNA ligase subunit beta [Deinococcales bacterium]